MMITLISMKPSTIDFFNHSDRDEGYDGEVDIVNDAVVVGGDD